MTICREWLLHRQSPTYAEAKPLLCRSWQCEHCCPLRKRQLMAQAGQGNPNRFLTLTVNPGYLNTPEERLKALAWAWRTVVKRLRREHKGKVIEYLAVVEETKNGEPHLHILLRSPFFPQQQISAYMAELIHAPIVDIQGLKSARQAVAYVAKYITKKPAQFGTSKRYWSSRHYVIGDGYEQPESPPDMLPWAVFMHDRHLLLATWSIQGYDCLDTEAEHLHALHTQRMRDGP